MPLNGQLSGTGKGGTLEGRGGRNFEGGGEGNETDDTGEEKGKHEKRELGREVLRGERR